VKPPKLAQMRRDQVIDPRWELNLRQVAAAGKHDETSVWQGGSERFGIRRRWRDAVLFALDHQHGIVRPAASNGVSAAAIKRAACMKPAGLVARSVCCTKTKVSAVAAEPSSAAARSPKL